MTEKGKKVYSPLGSGIYNKAGFCMAHTQVESLTNYTKPMDVRGLTLVNVKYTTKIVNIVPFIDEIVKIEDFKHFKGITLNEISKKEKAELILTEMKGWVHFREFRRSN